MSWSIGFCFKHKRDIGYGVPAKCDHPECDEEINRGLSYICGGNVDGGEKGCGLFFCSEHLYLDKETQLCDQCYKGLEEFKPKADIEEWVDWKLTDPSWEQWRLENASYVAELKAQHV